MNRVVRGSSMLIVTAIVAACAAKRDEGQPVLGRQGPEAQQPATEEDARRDKAAETREVVIDIQQVKVAPPLAEPPAFKDEAALATAAAPAMQALVAGSVSGNVCCVPVYQQPTNTERYQHLDDNPVHLVTEQPVSTFSIDVDTGAYANAHADAVLDGLLLFARARTPGAELA